MRCGSTSTAMITPPFMVAASGWAPPMPPRPAVSTSRPCERAAEVLARGLGEGLVGALQDPLGADVDPGAGRHLAVHHQALAVELVEVLPGGPGGHEHRVGDEHARRVGVGAEDAHRLAGLHEQRLVVLQLAQAARRSRRSTPSCARPCRCRRRPRGPPAAPPPPGSRLFMSMRRAASCGQDRQESAVPRGRADRPRGARSADASHQIALVVGRVVLREVVVATSRRG